LNYRKYDFKGKKRKISEDDDEQSLAESVRTISALFQAGGNGILPSRNSLDASLEVRVASIGAEIAAAIAQAQSRVYELDEEEDEEDEESEELGVPEVIGPNTSGIRDVGMDKGLVEDDDDSDAFPVPLRTRKAKDSPAIGNKRKR